MPLLEPLGPLVPDVARIAVLRANSLGDFVVTLPALDALRAAYPDAEVTLLGTGLHAALLAGRPGPWDQVAVVPPYPGVSGGADPDAPEVLAFFEEQRRRRYDLAVQLHGGGAGSNPFVTALGARVTAGMRDRGAPPLDRDLPYVYYHHEVSRFLEAVSLVGATPVSLEPRLTVTPRDHALADTALGPDPDPVVVVHPGATDPRRRWPAERFAVVADELADRGARVVLVGQGDDDEQSAGRIAAAMRHPALDLVGRLPLPALVGVLARARLLIGNDSGPRHLAGAVGTPTASVYWCGNVINAGPFTRSRHRVAVSFLSVCPTCGADQGHGRCAHNPSFVGDVAVDEVLTMALDLYGGAAHLAALTA